MRNSTTREFSHLSNSALIFRSLTASDVDLSLIPFYLSSILAAGADGSVVQYLKARSHNIATGWI